MKISFEEIREKLIGLNAVVIKDSYGGWLRVGLGEKIYHDKKNKKGKYICEWDTASINSSWRVVNDEKILCTFNDEIEYCNDILSELKLGKIVDVLKTSNFDYKFIFDSGISIEYFCQSVDGSNLSILGRKENSSYELFSDGWEKEDVNEANGKLTKMDEIINSLSEDCQNRWKDTVPKKEDENECDDCFYFRGLGGHFYFWDYGICSNKESKNDGKLVNVKSGCAEHKQLKDLMD